MECAAASLLSSRYGRSPACDVNAHAYEVQTIDRLEAE